MGVMMDDNNQGIHAEARKESFIICDDAGEHFSLELEWELLDELQMIVEQLAAWRDKHVKRTTRRVCRDCLGEALGTDVRCDDCRGEA